MMQMHYFLRNLRVPIGKVGHLYLTRIREEIFSAARLPLNTILGNWAYLTRNGCSAAAPLCDQRPYPSASQASPLHIVE